MVFQGSFWEWHSSWWNFYQAKPDGVLWLSYEEMKANPKDVITKVAKFISVEADARLIEDVAIASDFDVMKKLYKEKAVTAKPNPDHFRKGLSRGWPGTFTVEESENMNEHHASECTRLKLPLHLFPNIN